MPWVSNPQLAAYMTHMVVLSSHIHSCKLHKNLSSQICHFYTFLKKKKKVGWSYSLVLGYFCPTA